MPTSEPPASTRSAISRRVSPKGLLSSAVAGAGEVGLGEAAVGENAGTAGASDGAAFAETQPQGPNVAVTVNDPALAGTAPDVPSGIRPTVDDPALAGSVPAEPQSPAV